MLKIVPHTKRTYSIDNEEQKIEGQPTKKQRFSQSKGSNLLEKLPQKIFPFLLSFLDPSEASRFTQVSKKAYHDIPESINNMDGLDLDKWEAPEENHNPAEEDAFAEETAPSESTWLFNQVLAGRDVRSIPTHQIEDFLKSFKEEYSRTRIASRQGPRMMAANWPRLNKLLIIDGDICDYITWGRLHSKSVLFIKTIGDKLIDWAAGKGYCSHLFEKHEIERVPIDIRRYPNSFINDIETYANGCPRVTQLAKLGYTLFMSFPELNNRSAEAALDAYEDGDGKHVIVISHSDEESVATKAFWNRLKQDKWVEIEVPDEAQPYGGQHHQLMRVFRKVTSEQ